MALSPIHPASLVDSSSHSPALLQMTQVELSRTLIEYLVDSVTETVDFAMGHASSSRGRPSSRRNERSKFTKFVTDVITKAEIKVPALLVTLVYIDRAKPHLQIALEQWANERVFLGALIVANKYLNDSTLKNVHWALCTGVFGKRDIGRIEREFLDVLDFELGISESDLLSHHASIMALLHPARHSRAAPAHVRKPIHHHRQVSHWSSDSSSDLESVSSAESTPPRTPEPMDVDSASSYVVRSFKHEPAASSVQQFSAAPPSKQEPHHQRLSSALNILRSFPIPHFHHGSSSSSSSTPSSSSSSSLVPNTRRCGPVAPARITSSQTTSVFV
ncbi:hypothetical protein BXZ70DRAFT_237894 [Cristinia sonorae]|uniref:Cyclin N-terminal domain-containing protein n=1 Tax=Cristinia sonorae TaxID=1940300 RepID=A0A8K0UNX2_9AGAR|nr:hypothetical protein BXZ70DRAFT_237894 [Cristinia sonorae]